MTAAASAFQHTIQKSVLWLDELMDDLCVTDERRALRALRAGLHTIRDRLPAIEAVDLAAQLPMLLRGLYFEGWQLAHRPLRPHSRREVLAIMEEHLGDSMLDPEESLKAVIRLIERHVSGGELNDVCATLPQSMAALWDESLD
jgi:uncharacterized protein (DUF2267 family)